MATTEGIRLCTLDGGHVQAKGSEAAEMSDDGACEDRTLKMPVPCFLIRHPDDNLI